MDRFESSIFIDAAPDICYQKWHRFEEFPHFMKNVQEVWQTGDKTWHWVVSGPLGHRTEWDAEMDVDEPNRRISWHSMDSSEVRVSGVVNFSDAGQNKTQVSCLLQYEPPVGPVGELMANIFSNPHTMVREDLENFKHLVEGTNIPAEKAHEGKVMHPDPFVVPNEESERTVSGTGSASQKVSAQSSQPDLVSQSNAPSVNNQPPSATFGFSPSPAVVDQSQILESTPDPSLQLDEDEYELIYGIEDDLPEVSTSSEIDREDVVEMQNLMEEESPYLGADGAIYSEDLIDMRNDNPLGEEKMDLYAESMDVYDEDLANFTEDLDEEIDAGLGPREEASDIGSRSGRGDGGLGPRDNAELSQENYTDKST